MQAMARLEICTVQIGLNIIVLQHISLVAMGGFWVLIPPKERSKSPQIETWNTINQLRFCQFLECQAPHAQAQSPPIENRLVTVVLHIT